MCKEMADEQQEQEHSVSKRISLVEALCGLELEISHLDGQTLLMIRWSETCLRSMTLPRHRQRAC